MKTLNKLVIKPFKDQYIAWIIIFYLLFAIIVLFGIIISLCYKDTIPWKWIGIVFALYSLIVLLIALISRLLYKGRLIITKDEIIKLHKNKVQFRIKCEKLLFIGVRKVKPFNKLLVIIGAYIGDLCTDIVSFRFINADIYEPRKFGKVFEMSSLSDSDVKEGVKEFVESITYKQALQISKLTNIPIKEVVF